MKFSPTEPNIGDRIKLNPEGIAQKFKHPERIGTAVKVSDPPFITVLWDGTKTQTRFHRMFLELADKP